MITSLGWKTLWTFSDWNSFHFEKNIISTISCLFLCSTPFHFPMLCPTKKFFFVSCLNQNSFRIWPEESFDFFWCCLQWLHQYWGGQWWWDWNVSLSHLVRVRSHEEGCALIYRGYIHCWAFSCQIKENNNFFCGKASKDYIWKTAACFLQNQCQDDSG